MASLRDRILTPRVARSLTDAPAIVAVGVGAGTGILVGLGPVGAVAGGLVALAARVAVALPRAPSGTRDVDPFALGEPWRRLVRDALAAERQFTDTVRRARAGPLRDELADLGERVTASVRECWRVAQGGHELSRARRRIDVAAVARELDEVRARQAASEATAATIDALEAQLATAARMDGAIAEAHDKLRLFDARLDEAVTRAIELSVSASAPEQLHRVGDDVAGITLEMEALRQALAEVEGPGRATGA